MELLFDAKNTPAGTRLFNLDDKAKKNFAEVFREIGKNGKGIVNYKGRNVTIKRGLAVLAKS